MANMGPNESINVGLSLLILDLRQAGSSGGVISANLVIT